jgi:hypothetical protein
MFWLIDSFTTTMNHVRAIDALCSCLHRAPTTSHNNLVLLLGTFRRVPPPGGTLMPFYFPGGPCPLKNIYIYIILNTFLLVIYDTSSIREPLKCVKTYVKTFY